MAERKEGVDELIIKFLQQRLTPAEQEELNAWLEASPKNRLLFNWFSKEQNINTRLAELNNYNEQDGEQKTWQRIKEAYYLRETLPQIPTRSSINWKRIAVAASIVGALFVAGYFIVSRQSSIVDPTHDSPLTTHDIKAPDKNRAQIQLSDGSIIYLDSAANGELANVNGVKVVKSEDGKIVYSPLTTRPELVEGSPLTYNTLSNPRGSKVIDITLADGSRVWLNAGSSVTYPIAFGGKERKVNITGEAYFEVSTKYDVRGTVKQPFIVSKGDMNITVLGTHFNVNAYDDESEIKVTLLEGSVKVSTDHGRRSTVIKPGQQAILRQVQNGNATSTGSVSEIRNVDVEEVMAWKNGWFQINSKTVAEIMKDLSRWYDVDVVYQGVTSSETFSGIVSRSSNISEVLEIMRLGGVEFEVKEKIITVLK